MKVIDILKASDFDKVYEFIHSQYYSEYEDNKKVKDTYRRFYDGLLKCDVKPSNNILVAIKYKDAYEQGVYTWDVTLFSSKDNEIYSILFVDWDEILGYEVCEKSLSEYSIESIVGCLLYEMSFFGFTEEEMKIEEAKLEESVKELESGNCKEFKTIEEMWNELGMDMNYEEYERTEPKFDETILEENNRTTAQFIKSCTEQIKIKMLECSIRDSASI